MKKLWTWLALTLAVLLFPLNACSPEPAVAAPTSPTTARLWLAPTSAAGDTLDYGLTLSSFGARATSAEFTVQPVGNTSGWTRPVRQQTLNLATRFLLVNSTAWDSASFNLWAWGRQGSKVSKDSTLLMTWKVVRSPGAPPSGTLDSTRIIALWNINPKSVSVSAGGSVQNCVFIGFVGGRVARRSYDGTVCANVYQGAYTASERAVTAEQQAKADSQCVGWTSTGGVVSAEVCGPGGPAEFRIFNPKPTSERRIAFAPAYGWEAYGSPGTQ